MTFPWITVPWTFFGLAVVVTVSIAIADRQISRRRSRRLRRLADRHGFRYSVVDRFHLVTRIAAALPADGVAVRDLMYRRDPAGYTYAFTAVYGTQPRTVVVVRAVEPAGHSGDRLTDVRLADPQLSLGEQYRRLLNVDDAATPSGLPTKVS